MRTLHRIQPSLPLPQVPHKHAQLLARMAQVLDGLPQMHQLVLADLVAPGIRADWGRDGLTAQQVLRMLVLYLMLKRDFELLEFHLCDSPTYRSFCLLGLGESAPKRSSLHSNISRIRPQTLQLLHQVLVEHAVLSGLESGTAVRTDTTPVAALMRPPTDSALLSDAVRVLARLRKKAQKQVPMLVPDHSRRVSYRTTALRSQRREPEEREALYFDLLQDTKRYVEAACLPLSFWKGAKVPRPICSACSCGRRRKRRCAWSTRPSAGSCSMSRYRQRPRPCRFLRCTRTSCASARRWSTATK